MFYKGQINKIKKAVVSDPSYGEDVWCRYEGHNFAHGPWNVQLLVKNVEDVVDGFELKAIEFDLLLYTGNEKLFDLKKDGSGFIYPPFVKTKEFEIGMDTACVALGINEVADEIKASIDEWKPGCALNTMTDGLFGNVFEGTCHGKTHLLYVAGALDADTGYSAEDVVTYLVNGFQIKNLELVKDSRAIEEKISEAEEKKATLNQGNDKNPIDMEI